MPQNELELLIETFRKSRVQIAVISPDCTLEESLDDPFRLFLKAPISLKEVLAKLKPCTVVRYRDALELCHLIFPITLSGENKIVLIGPYAEEYFSPERILEISEKNGFLPKKRKVIEDYFSAVPVLDEYNSLFLLLETFCERLWNGHYELIDHRGALMNYLMVEKEFDDVFLDMQNMERRYDMENEIMNAVATGSEQKVNQLFAFFSEHSFEKRLADPIRNSKNFCIIMNTLFRKAAERCGVHPIYLHAISSGYALQIEQIKQNSQVRALMSDMVRSYCKLVRKNSLGNYSPIVKKTVIAIAADPAAELNLHTLSQKLSVSKVYLSSIFKKETGQTLTEFIRDKRMNYATTLLSTTSLQIQTVALHCGIVDVQYFSKLFKKHTGKTPSQFRKELGNHEREKFGFF